MAKKNIGLNTSIQVLQSRVAELEAELKKHDWISVEDRLPRKDSRWLQYLVLTNEMADACSYREFDEGWQWDSDRGEVTHWKPINSPEIK